MISNPSKNTVIVCLFILGIVTRLLLLNTHGSADLNEYMRWGKNTHDVGLSKAFEGGYFPIQYLIFGVTDTVAGVLGTTPEGAIKITNLIFEIGCLALLGYLLRKHLSLLSIMLLFWLNPFAITISQQGYVDAQFGFFILLSLICLAHHSTGFKKYLLAGIPLGISLLMKPQTAPLMVGLVLLAIVFLFLKQRKDILKIVTMFIAPIILYAGFSLYFALTLDITNNHKSLTSISARIQDKTHLSPRLADISANSLFLTAQYVFVATQRMPAINAQMPNAWFFVANILNNNNERIYRVKDTQKLFGLQYRTMGSLLFFAVLIVIMIKISRSTSTLDRKIILSLTAIPILLPYLTTSAHENHFYLGFICSIILGGFLSDKFILYGGFILGTLNAINLIQYYILPYYAGIEHTTLNLTPVTLVSSIIFFTLLYHLLFKLHVKVSPL